MSLTQKNKGFAHPFVDFMAQKESQEEYHWKDRQFITSQNFAIALDYKKKNYLFSYIKLNATKKCAYDFYIL